MHRHHLGLMLSLLLVAAAGLFVQAPPARAAAHDVSVADFSFTDAASSGSTTTITAGESVTWTWTGSAPHTVTSDAPGTELDSGPPQSAGTYIHAFSTLGTFHYHCEVHPSQMMGTVVVQAAAPTSTSTSTAAATSTPVAPSATPDSTRTPISTDTPAGARTPAPAASASPEVPASQLDAETGAATQLPRTGAGADSDATPVAAALVLALVGGAALSLALIARRRA